jgi:hypothetical protein
MVLRRIQRWPFLACGHPRLETNLQRRVPNRSTDSTESTDRPPPNQTSFFSSLFARPPHPHGAEKLACRFEIQTPGFEFVTKSSPSSCCCSSSSSSSSSFPPPPPPPFYFRWRVPSPISRPGASDSPYAFRIYSRCLPQPPPPPSTPYSSFRPSPPSRSAMVPPCPPSSSTCACGTCIRNLK